LKLDLDRLEKLCREATPGEWWNESEIIHAKADNWTEEIHRCDHICKCLRETDAQIIAEARSALPALIARVREAEKLAGAVKEFEKSCCIEIHEDPLNTWYELTQALAEWEGK